MSDEESRSERLRNKRSQAAQAAQQSQPAQPSETEPDDAGGDSESVKDVFEGVMVYLPPEQVKRMGRLYSMLKAEYEYEFDEDFEKNRHFRPLVVKYGLDGLDGLDAEEIKERLDVSIPD